MSDNAEEMKKAITEQVDEIEDAMRDIDGWFHERAATRDRVYAAIAKLRDLTGQEEVREEEDNWVPSALLHMAQAVEDGEGPPCMCDGDNVALQVLCRAFDEDPADLMEEWRAYDKSGWLWWGRALGAFMREKIEPGDMVALRDARFQVDAACAEVEGREDHLMRSAEWFRRLRDCLDRALESTP